MVGYDFYILAFMGASLLLELRQNHLGLVGEGGDIVLVGGYVGGAGEGVPLGLHVGVPLEIDGDGGHLVLGLHILLQLDDGAGEPDAPTFTTGTFLDATTRQLQILPISPDMTTPEVYLSADRKSGSFRSTVTCLG